MAQLGNSLKLWFDVGIKRYTTRMLLLASLCVLWFDVGIKRYTPRLYPYTRAPCCGLM